MKLICKKCGKIFESLIIDQEIAYKEVFNTSVKHIQQHHKLMFEELQKQVAIGINALTTFMHFNEFCLVTEDQVRLTAALEQSQEIVMACLGYDPEEEEEDEIEPGGDNESDEELEPLDPAELEPLEELKAKLPVGQ